MRTIPITRATFTFSTTFTFNSTFAFSNTNDNRKNTKNQTANQHHANEPEERSTSVWRPRLANRKR